MKIIQIHNSRSLRIIQYIRRLSLQISSAVYLSVPWHLQIDNAAQVHVKEQEQYKQCKQRGQQ